MALLPTPTPQQQALSQQLADLIQQKIKNNGGWINFADYMQMALYTPALGYYAGDATKFGLQGDFVTAPEISPLFAKTLALQAAQILETTHGNILELGAGTGKLAADLLLELQQLEQLPTQYFILEVSDHLRQIQRETLQKKLPDDLFKRVVWLEQLPPSAQPSPATVEGVAVMQARAPALHIQPSPTEVKRVATSQLTDISPSPLEGEPAFGFPASVGTKAPNAGVKGWGEGSKGFNGLIIANEVLDAIPVQLIVNTAQGLRERGVAFDGGFIWQDKPLQKGKLYDEVSTYSLPIGYLTEFCPAASGLVRSLADVLEKGVILIIDYGFGAAEYYHPQRNLGTLMCHYQHYAHTNPLINVGLQDITAHVNFTQIAQIAVNLDLACEPHGVRLAGYASQSQFLINCGILDILAQTSPADMAAYAPLAAATQKLLSPAEMGDLFKVIAFSKNVDAPLIGFKSGDKSHTL